MFWNMGSKAARALGISVGNNQNKFVALAKRYRALSATGFFYYLISGCVEGYDEGLGLAMYIQCGIGGLCLLLAYAGLKSKWHMPVFVYGLWHSLMAILAFLGSIVLFLHLTYDVWSEHLQEGFLHSGHLALTIGVTVYFLVSAYTSFRLAGHFYRAKFEKWSPLADLDIPMSSVPEHL